MNETTKPSLSDAPTCSETYATTLRNIHGMIITIEKGTRVKVTQKDENGECTINLFLAANPSPIWYSIVGVPTKYLQFDSQNAEAIRPATTGPSEL